MLWSTYHCVHGMSCFCTLSASAFIESSLHGLDFFLEIFFMKTLVICSTPWPHSLINNHPYAVHYAHCSIWSCSCAYRVAMYVSSLNAPAGWGTLSNYVCYHCKLNTCSYSCSEAWMTEQLGRIVNTQSMTVI